MIGSSPTSLGRQSLRGLTIAMVVNGMLAYGAPPVWWSNGIPPVVDPLAAPNNQGVANVGQAKWMAKHALDSLRIIWPSVAGLVEGDLVGVGKPIASWDAPVTAEEKEAQRAPLLIGQLKAISAPFYTRLHAAAPLWLAGERTVYSMPDTGTYFPWTTTGDDDSNKSPALIGQLKAVFSLDFFADRETGPAADGLPDLWEYRFFGNLSYGANDDPDGDGLTNAEERDWGLDPQVDEMTSSAPVRTTYTYDVNGRLTGKAGQGGSATYAFDEEGNILYAH